MKHNKLRHRKNYSLALAFFRSARRYVSKDSPAYKCKGMTIRFLTIAFVTGFLVFGCSNKSISPARNVHIQFKNHELNTVLKKIHSFATKNGLSQEPISIKPIAESVIHYRNTQIGERTVYEIFSKKISDTRVTLGLGNSKIYCGLDIHIFIHNDDKKHHFIEIFDSFITEISSKYIVEPISENSIHRNKVRFGIANSNKECI